MTQLPFRPLSPSPSPSSSGPLVPFGRPMRHAHFSFSPSYTPLNHGSYGTYPVSVRGAHAALQSEAEAAPDRFIVLEWSSRLRESRAAAAGLLNCKSVDDVVFVPNATVGIDTVLKNIVWEKGDVVLVYEVVYNAVRQGLAWLEEMFGVRVEVVKLGVPLPDDEVVGKVVGAARRVNANENERVRLAIVDTIVSMPGFRIPFERLVPALQAEGALVLVDGAHGIGHIPIDLEALDPDFFVTNMHKWLFVPRGAAAMYIPKRNQGMIRTTLPTSARYRRPGKDGVGFVELFDFTATLDMTNFLTVNAALAFRTQICGGEAAIQEYCFSVARRAGEVAAAIFETEVMDSPGSRMRECNFANVRLPLTISSSSANQNEDGKGKGEWQNGVIPAEHADRVGLWFKATGVRESGCYFQTCAYGGAFWWRLSGMIYVDVEDFRKGAEILKGLCERAGKGEYLA
ncbi:putative aminotransferase family protein [Nemania sp. FL0916]|nr:putative aminotransferase family protein [Nemania sp. FL0916]